MEISEVSSAEYAEAVKTPIHVFSSSEFNDANSDKCDEVKYLLFKEGKNRLGIIGGIKGGRFCSPFSAPFGGFSFLSEDVKIGYIDDAVDALELWSKSRGYIAVDITLPPTIYHESFLAKVTNSFFRKKFITDRVDLNYSFALKNLDENYIDRIWHNARKNLNRSLSGTFNFRHCSTLPDKELAYDIIRQNRETRGFPLRMSLNQVMDTSKLIHADFFLLSNSSDICIASAVVFHVSPEIVQVIYWGDLPEFNHLRTMNYLSYKVFEFYKGTTVKIIDIGPSTENSIPNFGLCEFKESIGCDISLKLAFTKGKLL